MIWILLFAGWAISLVGLLAGVIYGDVEMYVSGLLTVVVMSVATTVSIVVWAAV